jgi:arylsulfatase A-like enzyme
LKTERHFKFLVSSLWVLLTDTLCCIFIKNQRTFDLNKNLISFLFPVFFWASCQGKYQEKPLNVLLIITDDQGWGDLSYHGNPHLSTPNIDALASSAVVFDRFYVSPVCAPTRASLLTGRYHIATGTTWVTHRMEVMQTDEVTIAELLKENGYKTGLFGKWHQGKQYPHDPIGQGFDEFLGFSEGHINNYFDAKLTHNFDEVKTEGYLPDVLTVKTLEFMAKEEPFFAMLSFNTPHSPFQVPDKYFNKYKAKGLEDKDACIYGMVENIDENIGLLMDYLEESGKIDNTIVVFMTDNGPNGIRYNGGMKGKKADLDEGGVKVPFFMKIPGFRPKLVRPWAGHIDILPTLADLLDIAVPDNLDIHGRSLKPLIVGESTWQERNFFTHHVHLKFDTIPGAVRNQEYLLTLKNNQQELYHLIDDPFQTNNIILEKIDLADEMKEEYLSWWNEMIKGGVEPPRIQIGHSLAPRVELPAADGKRFGKVKYMGEMGWANDWFVGFENQKDGVFWELEAVEHCEYEVYIQMSNDVPLGLLLYLNDQQQEIILDSANQAELIPNKDRVLRVEVEEYIWPEIPLGKIKFEKGKLNLKLGIAQDVAKSPAIKGLVLRKILS